MPILSFVDLHWPSCQLSATDVPWTRICALTPHRHDTLGQLSSVAGAANWYTAIYLLSRRKQPRCHKPSICLSCGLIVVGCDRRLRLVSFVGIGQRLLLVVVLLERVSRQRIQPYERLVRVPANEQLVTFDIMSSLKLCAEVRQSR